MLSFSSKKDLKLSIVNFESNNNSLKESPDGFKSLADYQKELATKKDAAENGAAENGASPTFNEENEDDLVCSNSLKQFLNYKYEIIVGSMFYKITTMGTLFTPVKHKEELQKLLASNSITISDLILKYKHYENYNS